MHLALNGSILLMMMLQMVDEAQLQPDLREFPTSPPNPTMVMAIAKNAFKLYFVQFSLGFTPFAVLVQLYQTKCL